MTAPLIRPTRDTPTPRERQKRILAEMLIDERFTWRSIEMLSRGAGTDPATTRELLTELGARRSLANKEVWTIKLAGNPWETGEAVPEGDS